MSINKQLRELYVNHIDGLNTMYGQLESQNIENYTAPYLIHIWEDEYLKAAKKVMIIRQETNGWNDICVRSGQDVDEVITTYKDFDYGSNYHTPFWKYVEIINKMINGDDTPYNHSVVVNNINKFGKGDGNGRPDGLVTLLENEYFNVLRDEMRIVQPDACIFLTGPDYDNDIRQKFPNASFSPVEGYKTRELARVSADGLPLAFRTYHPGFGQRCSEWYEQVLSTIVNVIRHTA